MYGTLLRYWTIAAILLTVACFLSLGFRIDERTRSRLWVCVKLFYALPFLVPFVQWLAWDTPLAFGGRPKWRYGPMNFFHAMLTLFVAAIIVVPWSWFERSADARKPTAHRDKEVRR